MDTMIDRLDRDRIRDAVGRAEQHTAGEIVPVVVPRSDDYETAVWRGAGAAVLGALAVVLLILRIYTGWGLAWLFAPWGVALVGLAAATAGALLARYVYPLQRLLAGGERLDETVHRRALQAFVEEEVFDTRDRTGILLFVSLREHRIEVLGDTGINQRVDPDDWAEVVARIRRGIKNDNLTEGLVEAIEICGRLLKRKGVGVGPNDENELTDAVRTPGRGEDEGTE